MKLYKFHLWFLFLQTSFFAYSQHTFDFNRISVKDGLPQGTISAIYKDSQGFIWLGTLNGLIRYDGYDFIVINRSSNDSLYLTSNFVSSIIEDQYSNLWIGTINGLNILNKRTGHIKRYLSTGSGVFPYSNKINKIVIDSSKKIWIGTDHGLIECKADRTRNIIHSELFLNDTTNSESLSSNVIKELFSDDKYLYVVTYDDGLNIANLNQSLNPDKLKFYHIKHDPNNSNSISSNTITGIYLKYPQDVWITTNNEKIDHFYFRDENDLARNNYAIDHIDLTTQRDKNSYLDYFTNKTIWIDQQERIWTESDLLGLFILDPKSGEKYNLRSDPVNPNSISQNTIMSLLYDDNGYLWLGTDRFGLNTVNLLNSNIHYFPNNSIIQNPRRNHAQTNMNVISIYCDNSDNMYLVTDYQGIKIFKNDRGIIKQKAQLLANQFSTHNNLSSISNISIYNDRFDYLWVGSRVKGIDRLKLNSDFEIVTKQNYNPISDKNLPIGLDNALCIEEDLQGNIWIATMTDIFNIKNMDFTAHQNNGAFTFNKINFEDKFLSIPDIKAYNDFVFDTSENIWISSWYYGLLKLNKIQGETYSAKQYLVKGSGNSTNSVLTVIKDSRGIVWAGTGDGLFKYNYSTDSFIKYDKEDGLINSGVRSIIEDDNSMLWISTEAGISRFDPVQEEFISFSDKKYWQNLVFNGHPNWKMRDGTILFGGALGFAWFHPDSVHYDSTAHQVIFTSIEINAKKQHLIKENKHSGLVNINFADSLLLTHKERNISIHFSNLELLDPSANQYKYIMDGIDPSWIKTKGIKSATYTNIPPGEYTFKVLGSNSNGIWNRSPSILHITITPPFWDTQVAYSIYLIFGIGLIFYAYRAVLKREQLKNRIKFEEKALEQAKNLDELKNRFFANISHEFRTPLTLIQGHIQKLIRSNDDKLILKSYKLIEENCSQILSMTNQLLDLNKLDMGRMKLNLTKGDICSLIRQLVSNFESMAVHRRLKLHTSIPDSPIISIFDTKVIEHIVYNLLSNAIKFTSAGGSIYVTLAIKKTSEKDLIKGSHCISLKVKDTGKGISREDLKKIYDRFYQIEADHFGKNEGTGIGLSLVREMIELNHGTITVESVLSEGTSFTVCLPCDKDAFTKVELESLKTDLKYKTNIYNTHPIDGSFELENNHEEGIKKQILIIEDNLDMLKYIVSELKNEYHTIVASQGLEGKKKAISRIPALIISDVMMPELNGYELVSQLKKDQRTSHIPIILLTAKFDQKSKIEGIQIGADAYISKPFNTEELKATIQNLIREREKLKEKYTKGLFQLPKENFQDSIDEKFLKKLVSIIENKFQDENFNVDNMAREIGMSRSHLHKKAMALLDKSPGEILLNYRMTIAEKQIIKNVGNISEIAFNCGFNSASYFIKKFKEKFDCTPGNYLRVHTNSQ